MHGGYTLRVPIERGIQEACAMNRHPKFAKKKPTITAPAGRLFVVRITGGRFV